MTAIDRGTCETLDNSVISIIGQNYVNGDSAMHNGPTFKSNLDVSMALESDTSRDDNMVDNEHCELSNGDNQPASYSAHRSTRNAQLDQRVADMLMQSCDDVSSESELDLVDAGEMEIISRHCASSIQASSVHWRW